MADTINPLDTLPASPSPEMYTVSPADTSLDSPEPEDDIKDEDDEKKPTKKRKSWGQELPTPKTNLPPRYVVHIVPNIRTPLTLLENAPRQMMKKSSAG